MFSSRRFAAALAAPAIVVSLSLSGCSTVVDAFGPSPDAELVQLAHQAEADSTTLQDESAQALRHKQAGELCDEIIRVCGVDPEGQPPASCDIEEPNEATGASSLAEAGDSMARFVADQGDKLPADSMDLVVSHVVDTLAASNASLPEVASVELTDEADLQAARDMLEREYAVQYGLGLASAYADDGLQERIDALDNSGSERITVLRDIDEYSGEGSAVSSGYELQDFEASTTTDGAAALVDELENTLVDEWRLTAARANSGDWRYAAAHLAAHAQRSAS